jgi:ActD protein
MAEKSSAAFGIFSDRLSTEMAIETLRAAGFRATDISSLFPDEVCTRNTSHQNTRMVHGAAAGAGAGAVIGYALGWLTGIAMSSDPVHQTLLAGTPLVTSLASLGTGGALGSLIGALIGRRIPEYREHYEGRVRRGDILIRVNCDDPQWTKKAMVILKRNGGEDIAFTGKVRADFMRPSREIVRPVIEKTTVAKPQLRLVVNRRVEETVVAPPESSQPESPKKSAASFR